MAIAVDNTPANVKPLEGAIVRRYVAGSAISPGSPVCMSSDGYIDEADSDALATNNVVGIPLSPRNQGTDRFDLPLPIGDKITTVVSKDL